MLTELHEAHPGESRMKALARSYGYRSGYYEEREELQQMSIKSEFTSRGTTAPLGMAGIPLVKDSH